VAVVTPSSAVTTTVIAVAVPAASATVVPPFSVAVAPSGSVRSARVTVSVAFGTSTDSPSASNCPRIVPPDVTVDLPLVTSTS
jgi:hypothetical protein